MLRISEAGERIDMPFNEAEPEAPEQVGAKKRNIPRIERACDLCRKKKTRCSGGRPCHGCQQSKISCTYAAVQKSAAVRHLPRARVQTLEARVKFMEAMIRVHGLELPRSLGKVDQGLPEPGRSASMSPTARTINRTLENCSPTLDQANSHGLTSANPTTPPTSLGSTGSLGLPDDCLPMHMQTLPSLARVAGHAQIGRSNGQPLSRVVMHDVTSYDDHQIELAGLTGLMADLNTTSEACELLIGPSPEGILFRKLAMAVQSSNSKSSVMLLDLLKQIQEGNHEAATARTTNFHLATSRPPPATPQEAIRQFAWPPADRCDQYIEAYFASHGHMLPILDQDMVYEDVKLMRSIVAGNCDAPAQQGSFGKLAGYLMILAFGAHHANGEDIGQAGSEGLCFFQASRSLWACWALRLNLETVQVGLLQVRYLAFSGDATEARHKLSLLLRDALDLGLDRSGDVAATPAMTALRHRIWWAVVVIEVDLSIALNTPVCIDPGYVGQDLPTLAEIELSLQPTGTSSETGQQAASEWHCYGSIVQSAFMLNTMRRDLLTGHAARRLAPASLASRIESFDADIRNWLCMVPEQFNPLTAGDETQRITREPYTMVERANELRIRGLVIQRYHWLQMTLHNIAETLPSHDSHVSQIKQSSRLKRVESARLVIQWLFSREQGDQTTELVQTLVLEMACFVLASDLVARVAEGPTANYVVDMSVLSRAVEIISRMTSTELCQSALRCRFLRAYLIVLRTLVEDDGHTQRQPMAPVSYSGGSEQRESFPTGKSTSTRMLFTYDLEPVNAETSRMPRTLHPQDPFSQTGPADASQHDAPDAPRSDLPAAGLDAGSLSPASAQIFRDFLVSTPQ